jgi:hypothetical protein
MPVNPAKVRELTHIAPEVEAEAPAEDLRRPSEIGEEHPASVERSIYTCYYDIDRVGAIYMQNLPQVCNIFVLLRQDRYDDELMDYLLDREEEILDLYPDELFNFQYLPLPEGDNTQPMPMNAVLILDR